MLEWALTWSGQHEIVADRLQLTQQDVEPGEPIDVNDIFVRHRTDVARVYEKTTDVGGGLKHTELEWEEPISDERVPGLEFLIRWISERGGTGSGPTYVVRKKH